MNFDELKNQWKSENIEQINIQKDILTYKEAHTPIDAIRRKMKSEFYIQTISLFLLAFTARIFNFSDHITPVFIVFYGLTCGFCTYYFFKFYQFYKHSYDMSLDSRKNLLWFYYEMKINIELYKALTYILSFIALAFLALYLLLSKDQLTAQILNKIPLGYLLINCFIGILIVGIITELLAKYNYGKYLKQIKAILDKLDTEEV